MNRPTRRAARELASRILGGPASEPANVLPPLLLLAALLAFAFSAPLMRLGDASDYILATESLLYDGDLRYDDGDRTRHLAIRPADFDSPLGLQTASGPDGVPYLGVWHSFYYSLAAVPFFAAFSYRGFLVFNALLLFGATFLLARSLCRWNPAGRSWAFALLAIGFSAAPSYVVWIHTETFQLALMSAFAFLWSRERTLGAAAVLGVAVGAQTSFGAAVPVFLLAELVRTRRTGLVALAAGLVVAGALPQLAANLTFVGVLNPMSVSGLVGPQFFSLGKLLRALLDPAYGLLWFYPAIVPTLIQAPKKATTLAAILTAISVIAATTFSLNFGAHQVGLRYANYVFPLFLFAVREVSFAGRRSALSWAFVAVCGSGLLLNPVGNSVTMDISGKSFLPYRVVRDRAAYPEDLGVLWQRSARVGANIGLAPGWSDGWTVGDVPVRLVVVNIPPTRSLDLELVGWGGRGPQVVRVRTRSGRVHEVVVPAGGAAGVRVELDERDVLRVAKDAGGTCILTVEAPGWVPMEGGSSTDTRRLGVRITTVLADGYRLL